MSRFDAAIYSIRADINNLKPEHRAKSEAAIRLLEAAGKIRSEDACWMASAVDAKNTNDRETVNSESPGLAEAWARVQALLSALPDEEPK